MVRTTIALIFKGVKGRPAKWFIFIHNVLKTLHYYQLNRFFQQGSPKQSSSLPDNQTFSWLFCPLTTFLMFTEKSNAAKSLYTNSHKTILLILGSLTMPLTHPFKINNGVKRLSRLICIEQAALSTCIIQRLKNNKSL